MQKLKFPKVIILYGPPAAGKGTQAKLLKEKLQGFYHMDFGTELRHFVTRTIGDYFEETEKVDKLASEKEIAVGRRIKNRISEFKPVLVEDLRFVIEKSLTHQLASARGLILEGPGRIEEEAVWLSNILSSQGISSSIFHLHVTMSEVIKRSTNRFYVASQNHPFSSYKAAKAACLEGEEPFQRPEDEDSGGIVQRYELLYSDVFAKIISIYQRLASSSLFVIDASKSKEAVAEEIDNYLKTFFESDSSED